MKTRTTLAIGAVVAAVSLAISPLEMRTHGSLTESEPQLSPPVQSADLQLRGEWVIDILDAQGAVVRSREVTNHLSIEGAQALGEFLTRVSSPGMWSVGLYGVNTDDGPCKSRNRPAPCYLAEPLDRAPEEDNVFRTLWVTYTENASGDPTLLIAFGGVADATESSLLGHVTTRIGTCPGDTAPADCTDGDAVRVFTATELVPAEPVEPGQQVRVGVQLTFEFPPESYLIQTLGPRQLANLLGRRGAPGQWRILLQDASRYGNSGPCASGGGSRTACIIVEPNGTSTGPVSASLVLTHEVDQTGSGLFPSGSMTLDMQGVAQAMLYGAVQKVVPYWNLCRTDVAPEDCVYGSDPVDPGYFLVSELPASEEVVPGQVINVHYQLTIGS